MKTPLDHFIVAFRGEARRKGFSQIPNVVTLDSTISCTAYRLYALLVSYAMQAEGSIASQGAMAEDLKCTDRSVRNWLEELEQHKLITTYRQGQMKPNLYIIEDAYELYDTQKPKPSDSKQVSSEPSFRSSKESSFRSCRNGSSAHVGIPVPPLSNKQENKKEEPEILPNGSKQERIRIMPTAKFTEAREWLRKKGGRG